MDFIKLFEFVIGLLLCLNMGVLGYLVRRIWQVETQINNGLTKTVAEIAVRTKYLPGIQNNMSEALQEIARVRATVDGLSARLELVESNWLRYYKEHT